jgi:hypothetical protein
VKEEFAMKKLMLTAFTATAFTATAAAATMLLTACGGSNPAPSEVPSLSQSTGTGQVAAAGGTGTARADALRTAAQCIRQHGIPAYQDPVLTPSGAVYTDSRSIENAPRSTSDAIHQACGTLLARANLIPDAEPPAPPQLVQAGVRSAQCLRAHGLPSVTDPTAQSEYTPGHGFGFTQGELPAGGKSSPVVQQALHACRSILDAEIRASTLGSLGSDG